METGEQIEDWYEKERERIEKEFLEKIKTAKTPEERSQKDREYVLILRKTIATYEEKYARYLRSQKDIIAKGKFIGEEEEQGKKEEEEKEETIYTKQKEYHVEHLDLKQTKRERLAYWAELFWFKTKITYRKIIHALIPKKLYLWWKRRQKGITTEVHDITNSTSRKTQEAKMATKEKIKKLMEKMKALGQKLNEKRKATQKRVAGMFKSKKQQEKEAKEDENITEEEKKFLEKTEGKSE